PPKVPEWLKHALVFLTEVPLGPHFEALLQAWLQAEVAHGFDENPQKGIPKTGRPEVLDEWIRAGRWLKGKKRADFEIKDLTNFAKVWSSWWDSIQPAWRVKEADGRYALGGEYGDDWGVLAIPGQNGMLTVVSALYFWGSSRRTLLTMPAGAQEDWETAVLDVAWMLEGLEACFS
ncbi:hypothetical protein DFH06DRAFT_1019143, partial [Mycena polygramma]